MNNNQPTRPRILLLAYYCSPNRGSEEAEGWNRALEAAKHCDTWVITREDDNVQAIDEYFRSNGHVQGLKFEFVPFPATEERPLDPWRKWFIFRRWHQRAFKTARRLQNELNFDLVHHVTGITYREPGYLWQLDLPFVWGPVGGTESISWSFIFEGGFASAVSETLRNIINALQMHFSRRVRQAARRASVLMVANSTGQRDIERFHGVRGKLMLDAGIRQVTTNPRDPRPESAPLRILWSGGLSPRKALSLLLKSLAKLHKSVRFELRVLGEGKMERRWKRLASRLGINSQIEWMGWLPYNEVQSHYQWADVFVFTSLRDTAGNVVLEAMSNGLPIICLDHQGMHDVVNEQCGIKVPVTHPIQVVDDLSVALMQLAEDSSLCSTMSEAAIDRAKDYLWSRLGSQMLDVYHQVISRSRKPEQNEPPSVDADREWLSPPAFINELEFSDRPRLVEHGAPTNGSRTSSDLAHATIARSELGS